VAQVLGRRTILVGLTLAGFVGYELVPRDERRVMSVVNDLCVKLNQTRDAASLAELRSALRASLLSEVTVQVNELGDELSGIDAVSERSTALLGIAPLSFSLVDAEVHVSGALARVNANLIVTERGSGEQHRDLRLTEVRLRKSDARWRIEAVRVDPVRPAEPEARP
jgi:ketosteroid isomerase-like protein